MRTLERDTLTLADNPKNTTTQTEKGKPRRNSQMVIVEMGSISSIYALGKRLDIACYACILYEK